LFLYAWQQEFRKKTAVVGSTHIVLFCFYLVKRSLQEAK